MRDVDSPITCSSTTGYFRRRMNQRRISVRDGRLSKFRAGYKQSDPYIDDFTQGEDVFEFLCVIPPSVR